MLGNSISNQMLISHPLRIKEGYLKRDTAETGEGHLCFWLKENNLLTKNRSSQKLKNHETKKCKLKNERKKKVSFVFWQMYIWNLSIKYMILPIFELNIIFSTINNVTYKNVCLMVLKIYAFSIRSIFYKTLRFCGLKWFSYTHNKK